MCTRIVLAATLVMFAGCGGGSETPGLVDVSGTVTMDGKPLPNASVAFMPVGGGTGGTSPSYGKTDSNGKYTLKFSYTQDGVYAGKYKVEISTYTSADPDATPEIAASPETVPTQYNKETTLEIQVPSDSYNFDIKSEGNIVQPAGDDDDE